MTARKVAKLAALLSVALLMGFVENMLPPVLPVLPYCRLGLGNAAILLTLMWFGLPYAALIALLKCVIVGVFSGAPIAILYSLAGSALSLIASWLLLKLNLNGIPAISAFGGVLHNVGQILVAILLTRTTAVAVFFVYLALFGALAGVLTGFLSYFVYRAIPNDEIYEHRRRDI